MMNQFRKTAEYQLFVETAPGALYSLSAEDGRVTSLNPVFERITGWSRAEGLGKPFTFFIHPDDLALATETYPGVLHGKMRLTCELRILKKSGQSLIGKFPQVPYFEKGKVIGVLGIARDITERKRVEEQLGSSREQLRALSAHLQLIREEEKVLVAHEIHGEVGQGLTGL